MASPKYYSKLFAQHVLLVSNTRNGNTSERRLAVNYIAVEFLELAVILALRNRGDESRSQCRDNLIKGWSSLPNSSVFSVAKLFQVLVDIACS